MKTKLIFIFIFVFRLGIIAQWYKLPSPECRIIPGNSTLTCANSLLIAGDGHILYSDKVYFSPSSGYSSQIYESFDDLTSADVKYSVSGPYGVVTLSNYGNSTSFLLDQLNNHSLYTPDDFANVTAAPFCANSIGTFIPVSPFRYLTPNFIYFFGHPSAGNFFVISRVSSNSGITMCNNLPQYTGWHLGCQFINDSTGYLCSDYRSDTSKRVLLKTTDFGSTWTEVYLDSLEHFNLFNFPSNNTGYLLKSGGTLLKTTNGGIAWNAINKPISQINCLNFKTDSLGYVGGNAGQLYKTTDGGNTWMSENSNTSNNIVSIQTFSNNITYFTDAAGFIYKNCIPRQKISITANDTVICFGDSVTLLAKHATTYTWSSNAGSSNLDSITVKPNVNTTYTVQGTYDGYTSSASITITVKSLPVLSISPKNPIICSDSAITLIAGGATTFTWTNSNVINTINGTVSTSSQTFFPFSDSVFIIKGSVGNCISAIYDTIFVKNCDPNHLVFFPNPASSYLQIESPSTIQSLNIINALGEIIFSSEHITKKRFTIEVNDLASGVYIVNVQLKDSQIRKKLIIRH